jgi:Zn-finger nucleic acid-binding protein
MPHRDEFAMCPRCTTALSPRRDGLVCTACEGQFLSEEELGRRIDETSPDDVRPLAHRLFPAAPGNMTCPWCAATMTSWTIYGHRLHRCAAHGVWCERVELNEILLCNEQYFQIRENGGEYPAGALGMWLAQRRLRKHLKRTTPPGVTLDPVVRL